MLRNRIVEISLVLAACLTSVQAQQGTPAPISTTIDAGKVSEPISKYDYGMFIEHIGNLINHGLWSEMLDDRKFYFPINSKETADFPGSNPRVARMRYRKWRPVGADEFVVMDQDHPFVGEQSPKINLEATTAHGIQQSGLSLRKGKAYAGRVILAGTAGAQVQVKLSLVWGPNPGDRQTIAMPAVHAAYATFPLKFQVPADTDEGRLEIVGTGAGSFHVGAISLMPTDNLHGFRPDTIALLRALNAGFWRLPGGNFLSNHNWRDAVGDPDKRPPTWDYAWNAMQPNDVGMDELMEFCKLINVDPYVTVNAGLGDADSAAALVEYANASIHTPMGALRAKNGHPEPYHVKYWDIGNEPYGYWQIGYTFLRYYVIKHRDFAKAMRKVDPSITLLASGAMPDEMTVTGNARMATGKPLGEFGTDSDWTGGLFDKAWGTFDGVTEHWYARAGTRFDVTIGDHDPYKGGTTMPPRYGYIPVEQTLIEWERVPSNRVRIKEEDWAEYQKRFPAIKDKKIFLSIDEWAYTGTPTNLKLALSYAMVMQEMFRHTDFIKMSAFTMGTATLDIGPTDSMFNTTGLMFKIYRDHFGTLPVDVSGNSPQPGPKWPVGGEQPAVSPGSPTYPLDVVAAFTSDRKFLTVAVVNPSEAAQKMDLHVEGVKIGGKARMWQMTGASPDAANALGKKPEVEMVESAVPEAPSTLSVAPISLSIYEFAVQ